MGTRITIAASERRRQRDLLRAAPGFADLSEAVLDDALDRISVVRLFAGEWLFRGGDPGDRVFLVVSGRLEVVGDDGGGVIAVLGPGETLGELAILTGAARSASVRALRDAELLEIGGKLVDDLLAAEPAFGASLARLLAQRLHDTNRAKPRRRPRLGVLTVVALGATAPLDEITGHVAAALGQYGGVVTLSGDEAELPSDDDDAAAVAYSRLVDQHEESHDFTVLQVDAGGPNPRWTRFALRQADRVVVVADRTSRPGDADFIPAFVERALAFVGEPEDTAGWLQAIRPGSHHFLEPGDGLGPSVARMVRRLAGHSIGVVLSGGGARGLAHIGVLEAIEQAGLVIDRIGGSSSGALIAGLYAMGLTPWEMREICEQELHDPFGDFTLPVVALARGRRITSMLERMFGDARIETLPLDFFCLSTDLIGARTVVHRTGSLAAAIACSTAIPGIAPPRLREGRLLVSGGVLNNLPTDVMDARGEGPIIASDVLSDQQLTPGPSHGRAQTPRASAGALATRLLRRLAAYDSRLPTIIETLTRTTLLVSINAAPAQRELADIVIQPDVSGFEFLDFGAIGPLVDAGREAARYALALHPDFGD